MKATTTASIKFMRLKRKLALPHWQAVGLLESLWVFAMANAMDGAIGRHSNEDIAAALEWSGDPDQMILALVETGWLDRHPEARLCIHDWEEHCPTYVKGIMSRKGKTFVSSRPYATLPSEQHSSQHSSQHSTPLNPTEKPSQSSDLPILGLPIQSLPILGKGGQAVVPTPTENPAHELTLEWNHYVKGSRPGNETFPKIIEVFSEALRRGITAPAIAAAIADPKRDRTEPLFLFSDRELRQQQRRGPAAPKSTEELLTSMAADPRQRDVLEVAYNGRN
jgi:hypothetical protein